MDHLRQIHQRPIQRTILKNVLLTPPAETRLAELWSTAFGPADTLSMESSPGEPAGLRRALSLRPRPNHRQYVGPFRFQLCSSCKAPESLRDTCPPAIAAEEGPITESADASVVVH